MKKLFSKTVAAMLSITCMGSIMTTSFNGTPLFTPKLIADAEESPCVSFDEETGVLTLYGNIENMFSLANYSGDKRVKEVKALKGTVLPADCNKLFSRFEAEKIDISNADTSHVTNMSDMFSCCSNLKYLNLDNIDTSNVTNMNQTFYACPNLKSINLQSFNTSNVTDMMNMFFHCSSLETLDLSGFDTSSVTTMACMFQECTNLESVDFSSFNTRNLENMNGMFQNCTNLKSLDFSNFDTSSLKHFTRVFPYCENLEEIIFGNFNTSNVTEMDYLFYGCISLKKLDLSSFDTSNVTTMLYMFDDCQSLEKIYVSDKWTTSALDYSHPNSSSQDRFMFFNCQNVKGGNGTVYDWKTTDSKMACIDTDETPGYLTYKKHFSTPTINDGIYVLESAVKPNMVADVESYEKNGTRNLQLYERNNSNSQKFKIKSAYNGYYTMHMADNDFKVISVEGNTGCPGSNVEIRNNYSNNNQLWSFVPADNGYYYIKSKTGNYLDVSGGYIKNNTNIQLYLGNGSDAQRWKLVKIKVDESPSDNDPSQNETPDKNEESTNNNDTPSNENTSTSIILPYAAKIKTRVGITSNPRSGSDVISGLVEAGTQVIIYDELDGYGKISQNAENWIPLDNIEKYVNNVVARADYLYNITWTCKQDVLGWRKQSTFKKDEVYHIPYGQPSNLKPYPTKNELKDYNLYYENDRAMGYVGISIPIYTFINATLDISSKFYTGYAENYAEEPQYSPYYSLDCSGFASYCWGIFWGASDKLGTGNWHTENKLLKGKMSKIGTISKHMSDLKPGDVFVLTDKHIVVVTAVNYDDKHQLVDAELAQETPDPSLVDIPQLTINILSADKIKSKYSKYTIYRLNDIDSVPLPPISYTKGAPVEGESIDFGKLDQKIASLIGELEYKTVSEKGQSFVYIDNSWKDMTDSDIKGVLKIDFEPNNCCIKATYK